MGAIGKGLSTGRVAWALALAMAVLIVMCNGCSDGMRDSEAAGSGVAALAPAYSTLGAYPVSDMSGYEAFEAGDQTVFASMTVADIAAEMKAGSTFAVFCGFADCPWCNALVPYLNDVALERGVRVGYLDTRADPAWQSNTDIADYDLFVDLFGSYLSDDDEGAPHLYTPFVIFIRGGEVADIQDGTVPSQEDAHDALSAEQEAELVQALNGKFDQLD